MSDDTRENARERVYTQLTNASRMLHDIIAELEDATPELADPSFSMLEVSAIGNARRAASLAFELTATCTAQFADAHYTVAALKRTATLAGDAIPVVRTVEELRPLVDACGPEGVRVFCVSYLGTELDYGQAVELLRNLDDAMGEGS